MLRRQNSLRPAHLLAATIVGIGCVCFSFSKFAFAQRVILFETFESDVPDTRPASSDHYGRSSVAPDPSLDPSKAVVTGGAFADPFQPGNHSMLLYNPDSTTQQQVGWSSEFPEDPSELKNAIVEFDLWLQPAVEGVDFWSYLDLRIGHNNPGVPQGIPSMLVFPPDGTAWNTFREQVPNNNMADEGRLYYYGPYPTFTDAAQAIIKSGAPIHVRYDFDGTNKTYAVKLDDTAITWNDGAMTHPWLHMADNPDNDLATKAPGINEIAFGTAAINPMLGKTGNVYIDNFKVTNLDLPPLGPNADVNLDGVVNIFDINLVSSNWANTGLPGITGDANVDGVVNIFDINLISSNWSPSPGGGAAVPEPSTLVLLGVAGACLSVGIIRRPRSILSVVD